jgi:hypothetical protein
MHFGLNRKMSNTQKEVWLEFHFIGQKLKTKVFLVWSKHSDCSLGEIKWHPAWRHYCYFPTDEFQSVFSDRCLISIAEFLKRINDEHKMELTKCNFSANKVEKNYDVSAAGFTIKSQYCLLNASTICKRCKKRFCHNHLNNHTCYLETKNTVKMYIKSNYPYRENTNSKKRKN